MFLKKARIFFIIIGMTLLFCIVSYAMPESLKNNPLTPSIKGEQVTGRIKGTVKNITLNQVVPNQEVLLYVYQNQSEVGKKNVMSDDTGSFTFSELEIEPARSYRLAALYQDVEYATKLISLARESEQTIELNVYSVSDDDSKIQAAAYHLILEPMDDGLYVTEYIIIANSGNTSFLASLGSGDKQPPASSGKLDKVGFRLQLPKGYRNINFQQGFMECCVSVKENTILYSHATQPGMTTFVFSYQIAPQKKIDLSHQLPFNTSKFFALISGAQFNLISTVLKNTNEQTKMQDKTYSRYAASNLNKGQMIDLQLELPYGRRFSSIWFVGIVVVVGLSAALVIRNVTARKRNLLESEEITSKVAKPYSSLSQTANEKDLENLKAGYLELISRLDEMYEAGEISQYAHHIIREEQKAKLSEVMAQLGKIS